MALNIPGLKFFSQADAKSRVFILLGVVGVIAIGVFLIFRYFGAGGIANASRVAGAPVGLQSVPGGQMSPEFYRAVVQAGQQAAQQAQITGGSAVPTMINVPGQAASQQNCTVCAAPLCTGEPDTANVADDVNNLVKANKLTQEQGNYLLGLIKNNVPTDEYEAALNDLVRQGKITPNIARCLLEKYKKQYAAALTNESEQFMDGLIKSGQVPLAVANQLLALQKSGVTPEAYAAELDRLVKEGKISPEVAAKLLAQYTQQKMREKAKQGAYELRKMAKAGEITPEVAASLAALQGRNVTVDQYAAELNRLVAAGKLTPAAAAKLLEQYKNQRTQGVDALISAGVPPDLAKRLVALQGNNASLEEYADELKKAVQAGLISPEKAAMLLAQYRAMKGGGLAAGGVAPEVDANIPGADAFAQLQQRVGQQAPPPPFPTIEAQPFTQVVTQDAEQAFKERQERIAQIQTAMSNQAAQLVNTAWQPPVMQHKEGSPPLPEKLGGAAGAGASEGAAGEGAGGAISKGKPLIKAGTIAFAVLDTAVDSDYPDTPVMATIVEGPLKGAKVMGKLALAQGQDRVSLNFDLMDKPDWLTTKRITAFAIDPDTARTVMASSVDHHYLKRYGSLMAASFLQGFASAITNAGTATTGIFGTSTTHPALSTGNKVFVALGQVGTNFGSVVQKYVDTPTTVKVNAGVALGILFMAEVPG